MRIVLRSIKTGLYLQKEGKWTADLALAWCFRHSAEAMDLARKMSLHELEVLLDFEEPPRRVALPLP
jgi:hypothetical protein